MFRRWPSSLAARKSIIVRHEMVHKLSFGWGWRVRRSSRYHGAMRGQAPAGRAARRYRLRPDYDGTSIPARTNQPRRIRIRKCGQVLYCFEAKYPGIAVRVKRSGAERVFQRIGKEEEIRIHEVDVVCSTDAGHFIRWWREGLLAPFLPEDAARHLPAEQIGADGMYATAFAALSP